MPPRRARPYDGMSCRTNLVRTDENATLAFQSPSALAEPVAHERQEQGRTLRYLVTQGDSPDSPRSRTPLPCYLRGLNYPLRNARKAWNRRNVRYNSRAELRKLLLPLGSHFMAGQLIPPPELRTVQNIPTSPAERVREWFQLVGTCEQFLLAGLISKAGPGGDLRAAYRHWYEREWEYRDRHLQHRMEELRQRRQHDVA